MSDEPRALPPAPREFDRRPDDRSSDPRQSGEMPFLEHLEALRRVLFQSALACIACAFAGWWVAPRVLEDAIHRTIGHAVVLAPLEALNERVKLSLVIGAYLALPVILHRVWSFVVPGLFRRERRWIPGMVAASYVLFALGAWASYGYVVPLVIRVLSGFMTPSMQSQIRLTELLGFVYNMALACGVVFQLPLVCMTLTAIGVVTPGFLLRQWRIAIVAVFLVTALITPGDVVTAQLVMGVPMTALYFVSVGLSWLVARRRRERETPAGEEFDHV
ncbi:MAG: twin-arginine translocase subunit TatC [Candidatus Eisenbacteria bacterium]|nr:twin-arginine translocase subunit TatC [Candidatus Eisenbacteria bacterium]